MKARDDAAEAGGVVLRDFTTLTATDSENTVTPERMITKLDQASLF
jgi:hypothetical protein